MNNASLQFGLIFKTKGDEALAAAFAKNGFAKVMWKLLDMDEDWMDEDKMNEDKMVVTMKQEFDVQNVVQDLFANPFFKY
jgi:hypothetical protein